MEHAKKLLIGLLDYIGEQAKLVKPDAFQLGKLPGPKFTQPDLANLPGFWFNLNNDGEAIWLRIERLEALPAPQATTSLAPFISASPDPSGQPPVFLEGSVEAHLAAHPEVDAPAFRVTLAQDFDEYARAWWGWSEREKPRRRSIDLYTSFFALKQQMEAEETAKPMELAWGIGVASWKRVTDEGSLILEYPLLTQAMEITIDERTMAIDVRPRDIEPRLEMDALITASVTGAAEVELTAKKLLGQEGATDLSPFDPSSYAHVLKLVASNLDGKGTYQEVLAAGEGWPVPGPHLVVTDTWILLTRPRQNNFLLEDLKRLKTKVQEATTLPGGPLALVTPPANEVVIDEPIRFRGLSTGGDVGEGSSKVEELYFPLPSNEEQITIIKHLERAPGVTVQGPPGTGKTHTIANVICHYLATGRRVLVTSRGEPALQVLQDKLPPEVRPLTRL